MVYVFWFFPLNFLFYVFSFISFFILSFLFYSFFFFFFLFFFLFFSFFFFFFFFFGEFDSVNYRFTDGPIRACLRVLLCDFCLPKGNLVGTHPLNIKGKNHYSFTSYTDDLTPVHTVKKVSHFCHITSLTTW